MHCQYASANSASPFCQCHMVLLKEIQATIVLAAYIPREKTASNIMPVRTGLGPTGNKIAACNHHVHLIHAHNIAAFSDNDGCSKESMKKSSAEGLPGKQTKKGKIRVVDIR
jgi:hypothetical protein